MTRSKVDSGCITLSLRFISFKDPVLTHFNEHTPHPMQIASSISGILFLLFSGSVGSIIEIAPIGHAFEHFPHPSQVRLFICAMKLEVTIILGYPNLLIP